MIRDEYYEQALILHGENPVVDSHLDLAAEVDLRRQAGQKNIIENTYLEAMKKAGVNLVVSSVYVDNRDLPHRGMESTLNQISSLFEDVDTLKGEVRIVRGFQDIEWAVRENKLAIMLYLEGMDIFTANAHILRALYEMGVRGGSLTWSRRNMLANGCCKSTELKQIPGGLSELGINTLGAMEALNMFVDVSHLNDDGFEDVYQNTTKPFIASHSNARSVHMNYRNLTDRQIDRIGHRGGVIGINGITEIVGAPIGDDGIKKMCDHAQYIIDRIGSEHVGIGLDMCDSYDLVDFKQEFSHTPCDCLSDHSELLDFTAELLRRNVDVLDVKNIIGASFFNLYRQLLVP